MYPHRSGSTWRTTGFGPAARWKKRRQVGPVGLHRVGVLQVREVGLRLSSPPGFDCSSLVVAEHGDLVGGPRLGHVHRDERAVRVPRAPARSGVHSAGEVLVAHAERCAAVQRLRVAGRVGETDLQRLRPAVRQRRQLGCRGRRNAHRGERERHDRRVPAPPATPCERRVHLP